MYRISYGKCVCFVLLVILAVLSCSGFRIDDLAMADVSKRNFRAADSFSNSGSVFERIFNVSSDRHRIRHRHDRQSRAQAHSARRFEPPRPPAGHIDVQVYPASPANEHFAQIPPTRPVATRLQRSSDHRRHQRQESKWLPYQEEDVSFKAYRAEIVVLAQAEGVSPNECVFKVDATYKNTKQFAVTNRVLLKIPCDQDEKHPKSKNLVKNKVQLGKSYVLFLNASSAHSYQPIGAPKLIRPSKKAKIEKVVKQVCRTKFGESVFRIFGPESF
ncbi:hypothetical protein NQ318_019710 [Aromia moschata]|uniref:Uncharacterized protein n=1 Tax=Aromia moschata TaxID=1265417 RepID=A0AAV8Z6Z6_9CUCU|nr:hypothetical protein NQ318_019710 [Aromia moschata]